MGGNSNDKILISQGKRKWYEVTLGSVLYAIIVFCILKTIYCVVKYPEFNYFASLLVANLKIIGVLLPLGLSFTVVKDILINTKTNKIVTIFSVGPFSFKYNSAVPQLDYISVFKNEKEEFEVNLWYAKNKHYNMYIFEYFDEAMQFGRIISDKLDIDLLDATEKGDFKWVEKE